MSMLINPYAFGSAATIEEMISLFSRITSNSPGASGDPVQWNSEANWSGGSNSDPHGLLTTPGTTLTIPSALNGEIIRPIGRLETPTNDTSYLANLRKNGASQVRYAMNTSGGLRLPVVGPWLPATTSDTFSIASTGVASNLALPDSWLAIERAPATTKYCAFGVAGGQSLSVGENSLVMSTSAIANVGSWTLGAQGADAANTAIVVPSGTTGLIEVTVAVAFSGTNADVYVRFQVNGAQIPGIPICRITGSGGGVTSPSVSVVSALIPVVAGDKITPRAWTDLAGQTIQATGTVIGVRDYPTGTARCLAGRATNFNPGAAAYVNTTVPFTTETGGYDTASIHDNATNPERFTCPSGCSWGRFGFNFHGQEMGVSHGYSSKSTGGIMGLGRVSFNGYGGAMGTWVPMSPGDYFYASFAAVANFQPRGQSEGSGYQTWAFAEFV